ncbi:MAG: tetratricopeptide repeat protein [Jatrophihabitantaceae bacterium]
MLFLVDTCFSGNAVDAARVAASVLGSIANSGTRPPWVGVFAACSADVTARDGVFVKQLARLLELGPDDPDLKRRWSHHSPLVRGDDLCDALLKEWPPELPQRPEYLATGSAWFMVTNPLWKPDAPPQVVEHLLLAARSGAEPQSWFTGRTSEVDQVVDWVRRRQPGMHVITGSAGTGKSAVLGRVVSASVLAERDRLLAQGTLGHADPGADSITAHAHARGLTANRLAELLNAGLERSRMLERAERGRSNANLLLGAVEQASESWPAGEVPVLVVDGLDEARNEAFDIARDLLVRLAEWTTVIVSTRNLPGEGDTPDLLGSLGPHAGLLDLDEPAAAESGRQAMRFYIANRLHGIAESMDPDLVADEFLRRTEATAGEPFLIARLLTDQLRLDPVDTGSAGWRPRVVTSLTDAFELNLAMLEPPRHRVEVDAAQLGRELLAALTWAFGAGFPEDEWLCTAQARSSLKPPQHRDDISWLLNQLGRFVVQDGEGGVAVYRLAHQSIADLLRANLTDDSYEFAAQTVTAQLLERYRVLLADGMPAEQPVYLWRYAWRHAVQASEAGLSLLRELSASSPSLRPDIALAAHVLSAEFAGRRNLNGALALAEEAVERYRSLAAENPAFLPDLAMALNNLGTRYNEVGRRVEAVAPTEEAVALRRSLAAANPAFLPDLAGTLNNLGARYSGVGRRVEAVGPTEESVALRRSLAAANPAFLPDLAMALNNLGNRYNEVGRRVEAVAPTEESVERYRSLAAANPAFLPDLAGTLNNLGTRYSKVGRPVEAVAPTEESVERYRSLAAANPAFLPDLAMALNNLGNRYGEVGRRVEAVAPTEEAVALRRSLAGENPAFLPGLAMALNNLGACYSEVGRRVEAVAPTEESVERYRSLAAANPAFLPDLAMALNNLGACYSKVGRRVEAVAPTEESVERYRSLAAVNPAFLPDLAMALNNLGNRYGEVGRRVEAVAPTEEAVALRRSLAAVNPAFLPDLARTLNNLVQRMDDVGRGDEVELAWQQALDALAGRAAALLYYRAVLSPPDDARAVAWLVNALIKPGVEPKLERAIHDQARSRRASDSATFDAQWSTIAGDSVPAWLSIEADLLEAAVGWVNTPTFEQEAALLAEHPELLDPASDAVVAEALLGIENEEADRLRQLRVAAQTNGVATAYQELLDAGLLRRFLNADLAEQFDLLDEKGDRLGDPIFLRSLSEFTADEDQDLVQAAMRAYALIRLSATGSHRAAIDALADQAAFATLLETAAKAGRADELSALAILLMAQATGIDQYAQALFYQAIGGLLSDSPPDRVRQLIHSLRRMADSAQYINLAAGIGREQPPVLGIIPMLTEPLPPEADDHEA